VLAHELLTGHTPWSCDDNPKTIRGEIITKDVSISAELSSAATSFVHALLQKDSRLRLGSRYGAAEVQRAPFFASVDWAATARGETPPAFDQSTAPSWTTIQERRQALDAYRAACLKPHIPDDDDEIDDEHRSGNFFIDSKARWTSAQEGHTDIGLPTFAFNPSLKISNEKPITRSS
jgi:hypothetical protein